VKLEKTGRTTGHRVG